MMVNDQHMIAHMSAMPTDTNGWVPALGAANKAIPNGGSVIAWSYGNIGNANRRSSCTPVSTPTPLLRMWIRTTP